MNTSDKKISPFLKWPGGKQWFVKKYLKELPKEFNCYYEPFLGGGSVFFSLCPKDAVISDKNEELVNLYNVMRDHPIELRKLMEGHQKHHSKTYYYQIRETCFFNEIDKAARLLYLNRTCYNGMYRVNKQGFFNVPIGTKNNCIYDIDMFREYSERLKSATIVAGDFSSIIQMAQQNDLIFADPPYAVSEGSNGFVKYNNELFTWKDQERLHKALVDAKKRGTLIALTNANCDEIVVMYKKEGFNVRVIERSSSISGNASKRGRVKELFITSF